MTKEISRRSFLQGIGLAGAATVGAGLAGCAPAAPAAESAAPVEVAEAVYMGCDLAGCTDPTHPHSNQCWESAPAISGLKS